MNWYNCISAVLCFDDELNVTYTIVQFINWKYSEFYKNDYNIIFYTYDFSVSFLVY